MPAETEPERQRTRLIDFHLHLHDHGESGTYSVDRVRRYVDAGRARGVSQLGFTEHLFRFREAVDLLGEWWRDEPDEGLARYCASYFAEHATQSLDDYVAVLESAQGEGLPIAIGIEVDYYPGRMDEIARFLDGYPLDFRLGSVHWLGGWGFDDPATLAEWERRDVSEVWKAYFDALNDLIASGVVDVLAHPDLVKKFGHRPPSEPVDLYDKVIEGAIRGGLAFEVSSAGLRKPVGEAYPSAEFLRRMSQRGVAITTASDAHSSADVGLDLEKVVNLVVDAGFAKVTAYSQRRPVPVPVDRR